MNNEPLMLQKPTHAYYHDIKLKDENAMAYRKAYKIPLRYSDELQRQLKQYLDAGFIEPTVSPFGAPIVMVPKANGEVRLCNDFRGLNKLTIADHFHLPNMEELLMEVKNSTYYSSIDLCQGYHQVLINEADKEKTAFHTPFGSFHWVVMPFGLINAPASFQRMMEQVFREYNHDFMLIYLDDLIIYSKNLKEHLEHLKLVFDTLRKANLRAKLKKCKFMCKTITFLGHHK